MLPITIVKFDIHLNTHNKISLDEIDIDFSNDNIIYWVHVDLSQKDQFPTLQKKLKLPENLMQLFHQEKKIATLIENSDSVTMQIECLLTGGYINNEINFGRLIFYLSSKFCLTATHYDIPSINHFNEIYEKYVVYAQTPCFILFLILDDIINCFSEMLLEFELMSDKIDLQIREMPDAIYSDVMSLKKQVMKIQHQIAIIRDIIMRISGRKMAVISEACRISLGNLLDHCKIIFSEGEGIRESLRSTLDHLDNALMQRMNNTMKVLTAFAAIFLPLSVITGIYGMNFDFMPELRWKYGYFLVLSVIFLFGVILFLLFKKRNWL